MNILFASLDEIELAKGVTIAKYRELVVGRKKDGIADFIKQRFSERYITPLEAEKKNGFCIMAVCCLMIETLESFYQGWPNTNGKSKSAFCFFFDRNVQFSAFHGHAQNFYVHVRCGILHQGETTEGWLIWRKGPLFYPGKKIVNATRFLNALKSSLVHYCDDLKRRAWDDRLWKNLRNKMDAILKNCCPVADVPQEELKKLLAVRGDS